MVEYQRFGKMNIFTAADLDQMPRFTRANLINCLTGIKPAILIGTTSVDGVSNLGLFSSVFHLGADPALIGFVQRPLTTYSHTYKNILASGVYTMNHVTSDRIAEAHHTSAKFGDNESEFAACGFGEKFIAPFNAPFVGGSPVQFGLRFVREIFIPENDTRLIIGSVEIISVDERVLSEDGNLELDRAESVGVAGLESYYALRRLAKFGYAKPGVRPVDDPK